MMKKHSWILDTPRARGHYMSHGQVFCRCCNRVSDSSRSMGVPLSATNSSNVNKHARSRQHIVAATTAAGQSQLSLAVTDAAAARPAAQRRRDLRGQASVNLRAAFLSKLMSAVPKHVIKKLYTADMLETVSMLKGFQLGADGTMDRDIDIAVKTTDKYVGELLKDQFVQLITDGATTSLARGAKPVLVLAASPYLESPTLISVFMDPDMTTAVEIGGLIKDDLARMGINMAQVTGIIGDNVNFNGKLARVLDVPHDKCIAHALALVAKAATRAIPKLTSVITGFGAMLTAGGSSARVKELEAWRGSSLGRAKRFVVYPNRFGSMLDVIAAIAANSDATPPVPNLLVLRDWMKKGKSVKLPVGNVALEEDDDESSEDGEGGAETDAATRRENVISGFLNHEVMLGAFSLYELLSEVPELIKLSSADGDNLNLDFLPRLTTLGNKLKSVAGGGSGIIVDQALRNYPAAPSLPSALTIASVKGTLLKAATAALASFNKHVAVAMKQLVHRVRFDPQHKPDVIPPSVMQSFDEATAFFGSKPASITVVYEYITYSNAWHLMSAESKEVGIFAFWHERKAMFPALALLGMRFAVKQPSSIAAERVFGMMRTMETSTRHSMMEKSFKAELFFRANSWVVDRVSCYLFVPRSFSASPTPLHSSICFL